MERGKNDAVNELLKPLADGKTIVWTDWSGFFTLDDGRLTPGLNDDGLHPSAEGHRVINEKIKEAVYRNLKRERVLKAAARPDKSGFFKKMLRFLKKKGRS